MYKVTRVVSSGANPLRSWSACRLSTMRVHHQHRHMETLRSEAGDSARAVMPQIGARNITSFVYHAGLITGRFDGLNHNRKTSLSINTTVEPHSTSHPLFSRHI